MSVSILTSRYLQCPKTSSNTEDKRQWRWEVLHHSEVFTSERSRFKPQHWACCLEQHSDHSFHYNMALKLTGPNKWLESKRALQREHGIVVNLSDHDGYSTAYRYISKYDENVYHSQIIPTWMKLDPPKEELSPCILSEARKQTSSHDHDYTSETAAANDSLVRNFFKSVCL